MTVAQFLKTEAGGRYPEVSRDPSCRALGEKTLAAMADGVRCAGFENDFVVFTNEDVIGPDGSMHIPTLIIHDVMDPIAPEDHVAWLVAKCRQCKTVPVCAAGHLIWVGPGADDMHRARVRFLREPERRRPNQSLQQSGAARSGSGVQGRRAAPAAERVVRRLGCAIGMLLKRSAMRNHIELSTIAPGRPDSCCRRPQRFLGGIDHAHAGHGRGAGWQRHDALRPDPKHLWNRLHQALHIRFRDGDGDRDAPVSADQKFDPNDLDPFFWDRHHPYLLSGPGHREALTLLDEFLDKKGKGS